MGQKQTQTCFTQTCFTLQLTMNPLTPRTWTSKQGNRTCAWKLFQTTSPVFIFVRETVQEFTQSLLTTNLKLDLLLRKRLNHSRPSHLLWKLSRTSQMVLEGSKSCCTLPIPSIWSATRAFVSVFWFGLSYRSSFALFGNPASWNERDISTGFWLSRSLGTAKLHIA